MQKKTGGFGMNKANLTDKIGAVFDKWELIAEEGGKNHNALNDNVISAIKKDVMKVLEGVSDGK